MKIPSVFVLLALLSFAAAACSPVAETPPAPAPADPFSANAYRVERDNLAEKQPSAPESQAASAAAAASAESPAVIKVGSPNWRAAPGTGLDNAPPAPPRFIPWEDTVVLNEGWEYLENNCATPAAAMSAQGWVAVTLPHSWNATDSIRKEKYRRDASWYRRKLEFDAAQMEKNNLLRFAGVGQKAEVYIDGKKVTTHNGGYSAFTAQLDTPDLAAKKKNTQTVLVRVSNEMDRHLPPLSGDFNQYGGIYREVRLVSYPRSKFFDRACERTCPINIKTEVDSRAARFSITGFVSLHKEKMETPDLICELTITDDAGNSVFTQEVRFDKTRFEIAGNIPNVRLWTPENPNLYTFAFRLFNSDTRGAAGGAKGEMIDSYRVRKGFRWTEFTPDNGFFLNGKPYRLLGINRHQDRPGSANALSDAQHDADLRRIKEAGFNFLRLAHYPQDDYVLQRCDELGLLVWEEIPLVNVIAPSRFPPSETLADNAKTMLREMINQHRDHPSVILWGIGNEISYSLPYDDPKTETRARPEHHAFEKKLLTDLNALAHQLDPSRKTILVSHDSDRPVAAGMMRIPDLVGYNLYKGWYRDVPEALTARLNALHKDNPGKPLLLSEYGAGADPWRHSETPRRYDFSQEYMTALLENYQNQFDAPELRWISGTLLWVLADFGASHRVESHPFINNKGLLDTDRRPKDAFYFHKARQQKTAPVLYIQSPAWPVRGGVPEKEFRVFSNLDEVELFHNGASLGKKHAATEPSKAVFRWNVKLVPGENKLLARGANRGGVHGGTAAASTASPAAAATKGATSAATSASPPQHEHAISVHYDPARPAEIAPIVPKSGATPPPKKTPRAKGK